jgi:hypothetical protein
MKTILKQVLKFSFLIIIIGCESDDDILKLDYTDAIQLKKNNYWIYESASIDLESGTSIPELNDSIYIEKDTVINDLIYYIFKNPFGLREIKRNVSGNILDLDGNIEFSAINFTDTLFRDPERDLFGMMKEVEEPVIVPAGTFKAVMFIVFQKNIPGHWHSTDPNNPSVYDKNYSITRKVWYAKNVGVIKSVTYYGNFTGFEINLVRYKVK